MKQIMNQNFCLKKKKYFENGRNRFQVTNCQLLRQSLSHFELYLCRKYQTREREYVRSTKFIYCRQTFVKFIKTFLHSQKSDNIETSNKIHENMIHF